MTDPSTIASLVVAFLTLLVTCALWHQISAIRYKSQENEKGKQYKWYQLFGKLNEIGLWVKIFAVILFGFMLFVCAHYLFINYPHRSEKVPDLDYMGVISAFFALLVTLLVGWNIYRTMSATEEMGEYKREFNNVFKKVKIISNKVVDERLVNYNNEIKSELNLIQGLYWAQRENPANAMKHYILALTHQLECKDSIHKDEIIEYIDALISSDENTWLTQNRLKKVIELVAKTEADGSALLLRKLSSIKIESLKPI